VAPLPLHYHYRQYRTCQVMKCVRCYFQRALLGLQATAFGSTSDHTTLSPADGKGQMMLTCTFFIILITVLVNGGACAHLIVRLRLRAEDNATRQSYFLESCLLMRSSCYRGDFDLWRLTMWLHTACCDKLIVPLADTCDFFMQAIPVSGQL
jgi:hypothetical protein